MAQEDGWRVVYDALMADDEMRPVFENWYVKKWPNARVPSVDARKAVEAHITPKLEAQDKLVKELQEELMKERVTRKMEEERDKLRNAPWNLSDDEITAVEKIAGDEGVNYTSAAQLYAYRSQGVSPSGFTRPLQAKRAQEDWRKELKNPESPLFKDTDAYIAERRKKVLEEIGPLKLPT